MSDRKLERQWKAMLEPPPKYSRNVGTVIEDGEPVRASESVPGGTEGVPMGGINGTGDGSSDVPFTFTPSYLPDEEKSPQLFVRWNTVEWTYTSSATTLPIGYPLVPNSTFNYFRVGFLDVGVLTLPFYQYERSYSTGSGKDAQNFEYTIFGKYIENPMTRVVEGGDEIEEEIDIRNYFDVVVPPEVIEQAQVAPIGYPDDTYPLSYWKYYIEQSNNIDDCIHDGPVNIYRGHDWIPGREYAEVYSQEMRGRMYYLSPQPDRNELSYSVALDLEGTHPYGENRYEGMSKRKYDIMCTMSRKVENYMHELDHFLMYDELPIDGTITDIGTYTTTHRVEYYTETEEVEDEESITIYCLRLSVSTDGVVTTPNPFYQYPVDFSGEVDGTLVLRSEYPMECWIEYKRIDRTGSSPVTTYVQAAHLSGEGGSYTREYTYTAKVIGSVSVYRTWSSPSELNYSNDYGGVYRTQQQGGLIVGIQINTPEASPTGSRYTPYKMIPLTYTTNSDILPMRLRGTYLYDYRMKKDLVFRKSGLDIILSNHPVIEAATSGPQRYDESIEANEKVSLFVTHEAWEQTMKPDLTYYDEELLFLGIDYTTEELYDTRYKHISESARLTEDDFTMDADDDGNTIGKVYALFPPLISPQVAEWRGSNAQLLIQHTSDTDTSTFTVNVEIEDNLISVAVAPGSVEDTFNDEAANIVRFSVPSDCVLETSTSSYVTVISTSRTLTFAVRPY